jgi:hypothetical protein
MLYLLLTWLCQSVSSLLLVPLLWALSSHISLLVLLLLQPMPSLRYLQAPPRALRPLLVATATLARHAAHAPRPLIRSARSAPHVILTLLPLVLGPLVTALSSLVN